MRNKTFSSQFDLSKIKEVGPIKKDKDTGVYYFEVFSKNDNTTIHVRWGAREVVEDLHWEINDLLKYHKKESALLKFKKKYRGLSPEQISKIPSEELEKDAQEIIALTTNQTRNKGKSNE